jgi:ABC-2 type transport system permease protein
VNGFLAFLAKDLTEIRRTWRIWVLPGILLVVAASSPILARLTPRLLESIASSQPGTVLVLPEPVATDAYVQFIKSLNQLVLIALIIVTAGAISSERRQGTAVLVLSKPVSRMAFILAKLLAQLALLVTATFCAAVVCWATTYAIFGTAPLGALWRATALWLLTALLFVAIVTLCSIVVVAQAGAAGLGLGVYLALSILASWGPTRDHSPAGLLNAASDSAASANTHVLFPALSATLLAALCVAAASALFERQELTGRANEG